MSINQYLPSYYSDPEGSTNSCIEHISNGLLLPNFEVTPVETVSTNRSALVRGVKHQPEQVKGHTSEPHFSSSQLIAAGISLWRHGDRNTPAMLKQERECCQQS